jgi:hypothetical protein
MRWAHFRWRPALNSLWNLAFYSGWPTASTALGIAREVLAAAPQEPSQSTGASNANA